MPLTYHLEPWLDAAEKVFFQAVRWQGLRPERMSGMGGVFFLAADAVWGWKARVSDERELIRRASDAWDYYESEIREVAARVGPEQAVEAYFGSAKLRELARSAGYAGLTRVQSTEQLQDYGQPTISDFGAIAKWQHKIKDWDSYVQRTLDTLTAGPGSAAVAGTRAAITGGLSPSREDWEAGNAWAGLVQPVSTVISAALARRTRTTEPAQRRPDKPVAADVRPAREPLVVKPKERGVTRDSRGVASKATIGPPAPVPEPTLSRRRGGGRPGGDATGVSQRSPSRTSTAAGRRTTTSAPTTATPRRARESSDLPILEAAARSGLKRAESATVVRALLTVQNDLPRLVGRSRLTAWRGTPTPNQRKGMVDHVSAIVSEALLQTDDAFARTLDEARTLAQRAGLGSDVRFEKGSVQARSGSQFAVAPDKEAVARPAPRGSQLGDGMFVVHMPQRVDGKLTGAVDLYILGVAEVKLASPAQSGELPGQIAKDRERIEGMGVRIGGTTYQPADQARPGHNRVYTAADLRQRTRWIVAAPRDTWTTGRGWSNLQRAADSAVAQPSGSVRVVRLPMDNAEIRKYAEHLLDILSSDAASGSQR